MRAYRLLRVALHAEALRWQSLATRLVMRIAFACLALLFLSGVLVFLHLAAWIWLRTDQAFTSLAAAGVLGGTDLVIALALGFLATRSRPSRVELEALEVRRRAIEGVGAALSIGTLLVGLLRLGNRMLRKRRD